MATAKRTSDITVALQITTDIWIDFGNGVGFENTYEDTVFWMSYPKLSKEMEE